MAKNPAVKVRLIEVVVIVGSILLAFAIDAAWQRHQAQLEEAEIVEALLRDLEANLEAARDVGAYQVRVDEATLFFLNSSPEGLAAVSSDSAFFLLEGLVGVSTFTPVDDSFSPSNLALLSDTNLRAELAGLVRLTADVLEDHPLMLEASVELSETAAWAGAMRLIAEGFGAAVDAPSGGEVLQRLRADTSWVDTLIKWWTYRQMDARKLTRVIEASERLQLVLSDYQP